MANQDIELLIDEKFIDDEIKLSLGLIAELPKGQFPSPDHDFIEIKKQQIVADFCRCSIQDVLALPLKDFSKYLYHALADREGQRLRYIRKLTATSVKKD